MKYPTLPTKESSRDVLERFRGYNHNLRIGDGEFYDMKNMTSDCYPVLSPREKRGLYASPENTQGMIAKDSLCYVDGTKFVIDGYPVELGLSTAEEDCPKHLISMGAYVVILPDGKYINTLDTTEFGNLDASFTTTADVTFELCSVDGEAFTGATVSPTEPVNPENMALWIDTSSAPHTLKKYSASGAMWVPVVSTYIKISSAGIGGAFKQYDGVTISGVLIEQLQDLNAATVIWACGTDYIVVTGILDAVTTQQNTDGAVTVKRQMPKMDYVIESGNRLWGCRYGTANNGEVVNEIYASKLGDFKNWNCFMGIATDSYAASVGTDGPFTGAVTHLGHPLFFKENCLHKVYGDYPSNFQIQDTACRGVQKGCGGSLAIVNEILYYKSRCAVCAYDGSLPEEISDALGEIRYGNAVAGARGNKYYVSMEDDSGNYSLFVYDAGKGMWHKEDNLRADAFCACRGELYCIDHDTKKILALTGGGADCEQDVEWMVQTGEIGLSSPDSKYISRITIRLGLDEGSRIAIYAQYDFSPEWELLYEMQSPRLRSVSVPIRPKRCDHMKLRMDGTGDAKIFSVTKTISQGSELP